jgi:hypothetical protein
LTGLPPRPPLGGWYLATFAWGLAEAVLFPVVPDVLLSLIAQRFGLRAGVFACIAAIAGACLGGLLMWEAGRRDQAAIVAMLDALPAIGPEMIADARTALAGGPLTTMIVGSVSGVPYKIFAAMAPEAGISAILLLPLTIPARAVRFVAVVIGVAAIDRLLPDALLGRNARTALLLAFWVAFYGIFWAWMSG